MEKNKLHLFSVILPEHTNFLFWSVSLYIYLCLSLWVFFFQSWSWRWNQILIFHLIIFLVKKWSDYVILGSCHDYVKMEHTLLKTQRKYKFLKHFWVKARTVLYRGENWTIDITTEKWTDSGSFILACVIRKGRKMKDEINEACYRVDSTNLHTHAFCAVKQRKQDASDETSIWNSDVKQIKMFERKQKLIIIWLHNQHRSRSAVSVRFFVFHNTCWKCSRKNMHFF